MSAPSRPVGTETLFFPALCQRSMGTKAHKPPRGKNPDEWDTHHADDTDAKASGPGTRPGTRSRIAEARERLKKRGEL